MRDTVVVVVVVVGSAWAGATGLSEVLAATGTDASLTAGALVDAAGRTDAGDPGVTGGATDRLTGTAGRRTVGVAVAPTAAPGTTGASERTSPPEVADARATAGDPPPARDGSAAGAASTDRSGRGAVARATPGEPTLGEPPVLGGVVLDARRTDAPATALAGGLG
ncbi:hypothetical protein [Cellulomonas sp. URHD0024]|uniref:hypothetical protein n=1 Tax=Cellulomonas sp. URHD0024 TaxID=1302620 RepID=UPI0003F74CB2|nr:hypothetical protein [Cellulomonas sp. URHD0024]